MTRERQDGLLPRARLARPRAGAENRRADRVASEIQKALSELLLRRTKDPRLAQVTVTAVKLTPDLRHARVFFTLLDDQADRQAAQRGLARALPFLRRGVAAAVSLRYAPELEFSWDTALEGARRIEALLDGLRASEEGLDAGRPEAGGESGDAPGQGAELYIKEAAPGPPRGPRAGDRG